MRILVVEDAVDLAEAIVRRFQRAGHALDHVISGEEGEEFLRHQEYDLVILDTPPAEHAIDFLNAPQKLSAMFQGKVVRWFAGKPEELSLIARLMHRSTRTLVSTMELLTGAGFMKELSGFFESLRTLVDDIGATSRCAHDLLLSPETAFVLMTSLDQAKLQEGAEFCEELSGSGYRLRAVIVNRAYPRWFLENPEKMVAAVGAVASPGLAKLVGEMAAYFQCRGQFQEGFEPSDGEPVRVIKIPELDEDVYGLDALERLGAYLRAPGEEEPESAAAASVRLTAGGQR
jgi:anion-transporting  ArsA/GET3 family ATPase